MSAGTPCPVCGSEETRGFLSFPKVPIHCNVLCSTPEQALGVRTAPIHLVQCQGCSHIFNSSFDPANVEYGGHYENSLFYSPTFRRYAEDCARQLVERHGLKNKTVLEIGSGDGQFLGLLCALGNNRGIAFDPSAASEHSPADPRITVIRDYFGEQYAGYGGDLICCRQVLEHIWNPIAFLRTIRASLQHLPNAVVFFEVPNAANMCEEGRIWDVIYEHYSYFTPRSLACAMETAGFHVTRVEPTFGDQYLCVECRLEPSSPDRLAEAPNGFALTDTEPARRKIDYWAQSLQTLRASGRTAAIWGAGSKGITFLNMLNAGTVVNQVVDVNPRKHGMFVAGTAHPISPPAGLRNNPPQLVLAANPIYRLEIEQMLSEMGVAAEVACL